MIEWTSIGKSHRWFIALLLHQWTHIIFYPIFEIECLVWKSVYGARQVGRVRLLMSSGHGSNIFVSAQHVARGWIRLTPLFALTRLIVVVLVQSHCYLWFKRLIIRLG